MNYKIEKSWITKTGLKAVCIWNNNCGHRCGYVAVTNEHPLFGKNYDENCDCLKNIAKKVEQESMGKRGIVPIFLAICKGEISPTPELIFDVHGGITYSGGDGKYPIQEQNLWWFGFDCGHNGDASTYSPNIGVLRSQEYVMNECENLAQQLNELKCQATK